MNIIVSPDTYFHYFNILSKPNKTELDLDVNYLINNPRNIHVLSKALIELLESKYSKELVDQLIGPFMTEIMDNNSVNVKGHKSDDFDAVLSSMIDNNTRLTNPHNISAAISMIDLKAKNKCRLLVIPLLQKPSFQWLHFKLTCYHPMPITLRYSDFDNDEQIQALFDGITNLADSLDQPAIFDRQNNLNHHRFDSFKTRIIHYYTSRGASTNDSNEKCKSIISNLQRARIYMAAQSLIHERKLLIGNYIVEVDEDFWNIETSRTTWKMDFTYCSVITKSLLDLKRERFARFMPR